MKKIISAFLILQLVFVSFTFSGCHKNTTLNDSRCLKYYTYCEDSICDLINKYNKYCTVNYNDTYKIEIIKLNLYNFFFRFSSGVRYNFSLTKI